jgi:hypothetical protein
MRTRGIGNRPFDVESQWDPPIEGDIKRVHIEYKGDVPSALLQYVFRDIMPSKEINCLSFTFIDVYVPTLSPRIHCSEADLQFAENTTFVFLCRVNTGIVSGESRRSCRYHGDIIYVYAVQYWEENETFRMKLKLIYDRQSVGQSFLVPGSHLESISRFLLSLWRLRVSWYGHSPWRQDGSVIYLYNWFWALSEQSLSGRSPAELTAIFYCLIWDSSNLEGQVLVFISPRNRLAQLYHRALGSLFVASYCFPSGSPVGLRYITSARTAQKTHRSLLLRLYLLPWKRVYSARSHICSFH